MSFRTESGARFTVSVIVVGARNPLTSSFIHPYFSTSNSGGSSSFADCQVDAWRWSRFTFSTKASVVGGSERNLGFDTCLPVLPAHVVKQAFNTFLSVTGSHEQCCLFYHRWQWRVDMAQKWRRDSTSYDFEDSVFPNAKAACNSVTTSKDFWNNILVFFNATFDWRFHCDQTRDAIFEVVV